MTTFERIKKLAKEHGMTLNELNDKANLGTRSIYRWKYTEPSYASLKKVAHVFGMTPDELTGATTDSSKDDDGKIKWKDLGMPYGGQIPDELNDMIDSIAATYLKNHPDLIKDEYKGKW